MNCKSLLLASVLVMAGTGTALACEYKAGETKFVDYATCRYGADAILVVDLPEGASWDNCIYQLQAFRPETLLAVSPRPATARNRTASTTAAASAIPATCPSSSATQR